MTRRSVFAALFGAPVALAAGVAGVAKAKGKVTYERAPERLSPHEPGMLILASAPIVTCERGHQTRNATMTMSVEMADGRLMKATGCAACMAEDMAARYSLAVKGL